jgi:hypothetical protein
LFYLRQALSGRHATQYTPVLHMSLYPDSGRVISASAGAVTASRDTLEAGIRAFWDNVGRNIRNPKWLWGQMHVDVLSPEAAVVTVTSPP